MNTQNIIIEPEVLESFRLYQNFRDKLEEELRDQKRKLGNEAKFYIPSVSRKLSDHITYELGLKKDDNIFYSRLINLLTGIGYFVCGTMQWNIYDIYGPEFLKQIIIAIFGKNIEFNIYSKDISSRRILIVGDKGSGKEGIANTIGNTLIHISGGKKKFVPINSSTLSADVGMAKLFGALKGAWTPLDRDLKGLLDEVNDGGCLFLDEIADMPDTAQPQILRLVEQEIYRKIHGDDDLPCKFHLVSATNVPLEKLQKGIKLRLDLFYRLSRNDIINVPSLSEILKNARKPQIIFERIFHYVLLEKIKSTPYEYSEKYKSSVIAWKDNAIEIITTHTQDSEWPGNLRQCSALMERILAGSVNISNVEETVPNICNEFFGPRLPLEKNLFSTTTRDILVNENNQINLPDHLYKEEEKYYAAAAKHASNIKTAAAWLRVHRLTAQRRMEKFNLHCSGGKSKNSKGSRNLPP